MNSIVSSLMSTTHIVELFGLLLDGSDAMFGLKDLDRRYIYVNRALESAFRVESGKMIGLSIADLASEEDAKAMREKEDMVLQTGQPSRFYEKFRIGTQLIDCVSIRFPVRDIGGDIVGVGFVAQQNNGENPDSSAMQTALENAQKTIGELQLLLEKMKLQAKTDALTGVWNRRQIEESIRIEMARMERYSHPFSLVFVDIDHFKKVNDTFGHEAGDKVLMEFCQIILGCKRATDMLGRWGGEEFLLLLPNTGGTSARLVADRIRTAVEQHVFSVVGHITASFGVATARPRDGTHNLISRADAALYAAKQQGRNRVETDLPGGEDDFEHEVVGSGFVRLIWQPAYECGNSLIDRQHRRLFDDANNLLEGMIGGRPKDEIMQLIDVLLQDVVQHFEDEEALIRMAGFAEADKHSHIHAALVSKALDMSVRYAADKLTLGDLFSFLASDLISKHLLSEDRKFFHHL